MQLNYDGFHQVTRIGADESSITQDTLFDTRQCNYMTQNYTKSSLYQPMEFASSQPGFIIKGGNSISGNGDNIDVNSSLTIGQLQTNPHSKLDLFSRPFITVPFLGRGAVDPNIESAIRNGISQSSRKTVNQAGESSYHHKTPLIPEMKKHFRDKSDAIEYNAINGWTIGGIPTRDLNRDR